MRPITKILLLATIVLVGVPTDALAWGPATHVGIGASVLDGLALLPAALAALLHRRRDAYLYGCIAADIVFAKRLSRVKQFCHHWSTGFKLLDSASDDSGTAFAYGYLSHLAADTIAHGKYVPHQIVVSGTSVNFGHLYWELRADATVSTETAHLLEHVLAQDHTQYHEAMAHHLKDTFLWYNLNRAVFDRMNAMAVHRGFHRTVNAWGRYSRWYLSPELLAGYRAESLDRIFSVLNEGRESAVLWEDPNGTSALMHLCVRRRELRRLKRRGLPVAGRLRETAHSLAPMPQYRLSSNRSRTLIDVTGGR
ncbi:MAG: zinc dependent phospholipase C family protein [Planctomycetes bacterium]|nr:zinc dependent phospholipase C family protein [Planctomycetota bacterium]